MNLQLMVRIQTVVFRQRLVKTRPLCSNDGPPHVILLFLRGPVCLGPRCDFIASWYHDGPLRRPRIASLHN